MLSKVIRLKSVKSHESPNGFYYTNESDVSYGSILVVPLRPCNDVGSRIPILLAKFFIPQGKLHVEWQREAGEFRIYPHDAFLIHASSCSDMSNKPCYQKGSFFVCDV